MKRFREKPETSGLIECLLLNKMGRFCVACFQAVFVALLLLSNALLAHANSTNSTSHEPVSVLARTAVRIGTSNVWISATEASVSDFVACVSASACPEDSYIKGAGSPCNWGVEGRARHPMNCVDWTGADAFCRFDGGRLCKPDEWFNACRGPEDLDFPYGSIFDASACHAHAGPVNASSATEEVGSRSSCSGNGVSDMVGNVSEWVDDCTGTYCRMYGGAYVTNEPVDHFASCKRGVCSGNQRTFASASIGIRCCYDALNIQVEK